MSILRIHNVLGGQQMKALSLTQPWASLVTVGAKRLETRSWYASYRGPIVIHASKGYPGWCKEFAETHAVRNALGCKADPKNLPLGVGLCVANLRACVKTTELHKLEAIDMRPSVNELEFGNFAEGRWAFALEVEYLFIEPIPAKGAQRWWSWPHEQYQVAEEEASS